MENLSPSMENLLNRRYYFFVVNGNPFPIRKSFIDRFENNYFTNILKSASEKDGKTTVELTLNEEETTYFILGWEFLLSIAGRPFKETVPRKLDSGSGPLEELNALKESQIADPQLEQALNFLCLHSLCQKEKMGKVFRLYDVSLYTLSAPGMTLRVELIGVCGTQFFSDGDRGDSTLFSFGLIHSKHDSIWDLESHVPNPYYPYAKSYTKSNGLVHIYPKHTEKRWLLHFDTIRHKFWAETEKGDVRGPFELPEDCLCFVWNDNGRCVTQSYSLGYTEDLTEKS